MASRPKFQIVAVIVAVLLVSSIGYLWFASTCPYQIYDKRQVYKLESPNPNVIGYAHVLISEAEFRKSVKDYSKGDPRENGRVRYMSQTVRFPYYHLEYITSYSMKGYYLVYPEIGANFGHLSGDDIIVIQEIISAFQPGAAYEALK